MVRVVIPEPITSLNKGEKAILEGIRVALSVFSDVSLTLYSPWYDDDRQRYSKEVDLVKGTDFFNVINMYSDTPRPFCRISYIKRWGRLVAFALAARISKSLASWLFKDDLLTALARADLIMIGHDGMFFCELFWFVLAGNIMSIPVTIYGVGSEDGAGHVCTGWNKKILQYAFNHTILNVIRDCGTRQCLINHGIEESKLELYPDTAILMRPCSDQRVREILQQENVPVDEKIPLFGLIPVRGGIVFEKSFVTVGGPKGKYELRIAFWVELVRHLLDHIDAHFIFLPHCIGPVTHNDDRIISREIADRIDNKKERITFIKAEYGAQELKGIVKWCGFILSERAHALIGAVSTATPCMALSVEEDQRMHNIVHKMFRRPVYNLNNPNIAELKRLIQSEWENRERTKAEMEGIAKQVLDEAWKASQLLKQRFNAYRKI